MKIYILYQDGTCPPSSFEEVSRDLEWQDAAGSLCLSESGDMYRIDLDRGDPPMKGPSLVVPSMFVRIDALDSRLVQRLTDIAARLQEECGEGFSASCEILKLLEKTWPDVVSPKS